MKLKRWVSGLMLITFLLLRLGVARADPNLSLQDASVREGAWADGYAAVLEERSERIQAYQDYVLSVTSIPVCRSVGLADLTRDGVPELLFLDLAEDTEYGFNVGRLWIYTSDGNSVRCALTLQPEIDDLLYSTYYLAENGLLTIHFSDCEMGWIMQLRPDVNARYTAETTMIEAADFSGEGPDTYTLNGKSISAKKYRSLAAEIQAGQGSLIGSFMVDDGGCGFTYTLAEARDALASGEIQQILPDAGNSASPVGDLPDLSFVLGSFPAGQKYDVYSAPSTRAWRAAKGKASITSGSEIYVAGTDGDWLLILYELDSGVTRVGYIDLQKIDGPCTSGGALAFSGTQVTLAKSAEMTDDPIRQKTAIGKLKKGTKVTCLAEYRGWIYVEAKVSGKTARGFIEPSSLGQK